MSMLSAIFIVEENEYQGEANQEEEEQEQEEEQEEEDTTYSQIPTLHSQIALNEFYARATWEENTCIYLQ